MPPPTELKLEALDSAGRGLRVVFTRRGDQFEHELSAVADGVATKLLAAENLPLQEVVAHQVDAGQSTLLATGAGGGRYWSLAVAACVVDARVELAFDVACRERSAESPPVVEFRLGECVEVVGRSLLLADGCSVEIVGEASLTIAQHAGKRLTLAAAKSSTGADAMTRWRYRLVRPE